LHVARGDLTGESETRYLMCCERPGAQALLVTTAEQQWYQPDSRPSSHVQGTNSFGSIELVRRERQQVDALLLDIDRNLASALRGVDVEQHVSLAAEPADGADVLDDSDFVVDVHIETSVVSA
jgi:hypothetical protein